MRSSTSPDAARRQASRRARTSSCSTNRRHGNASGTLTADPEFPREPDELDAAPPVLVILLADPGRYIERYSRPDKIAFGLDHADAWPVKFWDTDTAMAGMLLLLAAVDAGLGGWYFGIPYGETALRQEFEHPRRPQHHRRHRSRLSRCRRAATGLRLLAVPTSAPRDGPSQPLVGSHSGRCGHARRSRTEERARTTALRNEPSRQIGMDVALRPRSGRSVAAHRPEVLAALWSGPPATTIGGSCPCPLTTTAVERYQPVLTDVEQTTLLGFLAGYRGFTRDAYTLDLRQFTAWCWQHDRRLFDVRRVDIECFARDLEDRGRGPRHGRPPAVHDRRVLPLRRRRRRHRALAGGAHPPAAHRLRVPRRPPRPQRARRHPGHRRSRRRRVITPWCRCWR